jgi:MbtH protein
LPTKKKDEDKCAMNQDDSEDTTIYAVVINEIEQYSLWPADKSHDSIEGVAWREVGFRGTKAACMEYIRSVYSEMRPPALQKKMDEAKRQEQEPQGS